MELDYNIDEFGFRITRIEPMTQDEYDDYLAAVSANPYETHIFFGATYISGYLGSEENLVLPTELNGRPVSGIWDSAFYGCSGITSVVLPEGVTTLGESSFQNCVSMTDIDIPSTVTMLGTRVFQGCTSLTSLTFTGALDLGEIGSTYIAYNCTALRSVSIRSLPHVPNYAFSNCSSLTELTLPSDLATVGFGSFSGCSSLEEVVIPEGARSLDTWAFAKCTSLAKIHLPASIRDFGYSIFSRCPELTIYAPAGSLAAAWATSQEIPVVTEQRQEKHGFRIPDEEHPIHLSIR